MQSGMIGFLIGSFGTAILAYYIATIFIKARVKEMVKEETEKRIKDLEFDNSYLKKKLLIVNVEYNKALEERNKSAKDFNDKLKGL